MLYAITRVRDRLRDLSSNSRGEAIARGALLQARAYYLNKLIAVTGDVSTTGISPTNGNIIYIDDLGLTNSDGYYADNSIGDVFQDGTITLMVVEGFTGSVGDDLDTNDDGTLDVTPWTTLHDDVAVTDGGSGGGDEVILHPSEDIADGSSVSER